MSKRRGRKSAAQTPAPKAEQIKGSKKNPKGTAASELSAARIKLSSDTMGTLKKKLDEFKEKHPKKKNVTLNDLKAVYRRGSGAYSKSHRPTITGGKPNSRAAWSYARVNKFLEKAAGKKVKAAYVQDDDLLRDGGEIFKRGGETNGKGDCYQAAGDFAIGKYFAPKIDFIGEPYIVHAEVKGQGKIEGIRYGHAWVEDDENVYDYSNGREIKLPKQIYYLIGDIKTDDPKKYQKYTFAEARKKMLDTGNYGSWDIETEYKDGGLIAPNGEKSNLTPEQYKLVRTPEFKAWFGDWENDPENASKVVDDNGEPMVVYHGTRKLFTEFKNYYQRKKKQLPFDRIPLHFFSNDKNEVISYIGKSKKSLILECFLYMKNPLYYKTSDGVPEIAIFEQNKDGFISSSIFAVPNSKQVKLADGTNKTFDMNNPDIRYDDGGELQEQITCVKCDWSWNTADSEAEDKYVCHKCGFDNSLFYDSEILKPNLSVYEISEKHNVDVDYVLDQLILGSEHELEHTERIDVAKRIALHHIAETPDYYLKLKKLNLEDGSEIEDDLFQNIDFLPDDVQEVLKKYSTEDGTYQNMEDMLMELEPLGYTFEYGLDAIPYDLKKIEKEEIILENNIEVEIPEYLKQQKSEAQDVMYCSDSRVFKLMICKTKIEIAEKRLSETENPEEQNCWNECILIWTDCMNNIVENNIPAREFKDGGTPCGCSKMYEKGGLAYGNSHDKGGMPLEVSSTGQKIEIEGGEGVVNKRSMQMTKKLEFEGRKMTPCEVVSKINEMGGGVKFKCSDVKEIIAEDGHF